MLLCGSIAFSIRVFIFFFLNNIRDAENVYRVIVNTNENNTDLSTCKVLRDFRINQDIGSFGYRKSYTIKDSLLWVLILDFCSPYSEEAHCNFGVKIFGDQVCSIVVGAEHGTHVAGIIAGNLILRLRNFLFIFFEWFLIF